MKKYEKNALAVGWALVLLGGGGARAGAPATVNVGVAGQGAEAPPAPVALPPLTADEREMVERLRATVRHLASEIGERNIAQSWNLASATDDLAITLEKLGYEVKRQGIVAGDAVVQNLDVHVDGGEHGGEVLVVGAHFDTFQGSPGADGDASGVAAVMELARSFHGSKSNRALHFAFFVNGEPPYFQTDQMGSFVYAKGLKAQGLAVRGMLNLDGLGVYADAPPARAYPSEILPPYPSNSNFVALVGNEGSRALLEQVSTSMHGGPIPVVGNVLAEDLPFAAGSDHWAFWKLGMPALLVTDAAAYRYKEHRQKADLPDKLDFERMARVVSALKKAITELAAG
jgi:hypothetical protein